MKNILLLASFFTLFSSCASKIEKIEKSANAGNKYNQYRLYKAYINDNSEYKTKRDPEKAHYWLEKSAHRGHFTARNTLIENYLRGHNGYPESVDKGISLAKYYGNSYRIIDAYSEVGAERLDSKINDIDEEHRTYKADLKRLIGYTGGDLAAQIKFYKQYRKKLGDNEAKSIVKSLDKGIEEVAHLNHLNKLGLEGVKFDLPSNKSHVRVAKLRADFQRLSSNEDNLYKEWEAKQEQAFNAKLQVDLEKMRNNANSNNGMSPRPTGYIYSGSGGVTPF